MIDREYDGKEQRKVAKEIKNDGGKVGTIRAAGDNAKPEKMHKGRRGTSFGMDSDDRTSIGVILAWMMLILLFASTIGFGVRLFLFLAGFREAL